VKHFTRNTVSAEAWCAKCKKHTQHRVDGVKLGPCLKCIARLEKEIAERKLVVIVELQSGFDFGQ